MHKIGVIGDRDSILGFKVLGMDIFPAVTREEAEGALQQLAREEYALVYITEQAAEMVLEQVLEYKSRMFPAIILIPGSRGSLGIGMRNIKSAVEKAVGADILFKE